MLDLTEEEYLVALYQISAPSLLKKAKNYEEKILHGKEVNEEEIERLLIKASRLDTLSCEATRKYNERRIYDELGI